MKNLMQSLTPFYVRFILSWRISLLALIIMLLFIRLGFWQLQRADEKKHMLTSNQNLTKKAPILWGASSQLPEQYQQLHVKGHFLQTVLLLDNQHYRHQLGYHVFSPFMVTDGQLILVDRGWLRGDASRQNLPLISTPNAEITVRGSAYFPSEKNWRLGELIEKQQGDTVVVELIDTKLIGVFLHKSIYPFIIRLGALESNGFVRDWAIVSMPPERHYAYAFQWFVMAFAVLVIFIVLTYKKKT